MLPFFFLSFQSIAGPFAKFAGIGVRLPFISFHQPGPLQWCAPGDLQAESVQEYKKEINEGIIV